MRKNWISNFYEDDDRFESIQEISQGEPGVKTVIPNAKAELKFKSNSGNINAQKA